MTHTIKYHTLNASIAIVWLINGLVCKMLSLEPRHQQIVAKILGDKYAREFTFLIGLSEIIMCAWMLSGLKTRLNVWAQIVVIAAMNGLEYFLVPDLLLWGRANAFFALALIAVLCYKEFYLNKNLAFQRS